MNRWRQITQLMGGSLVLAAMLAGMSQAASPTAEQALKLAPIQGGVDCARPTPEEAAKCTIGAKKIDGKVGWVVEDANGVMLRLFTDTNGDNIVDQWCYFKNGLEVYRDIDSNYNGKADQCRWFNTGGSRWALDKNEDGQIDAWKMISAEEVTAEVVAALANRDLARFLRVAISSTELESIGLGTARNKQIAERIAKLEAGFKDLAAKQKEITSETRWTQFSGSLPGVVPVGTDGSTKDVRVYENVVAIVTTGDAHGQLQIGTLVAVGDSWRVIDLPQLILPDTPLAGAGFFFQPVTGDRSPSATPVANDQMQKSIGQLEKIDQAVAKATSREELAKLTTQRIDVMEQIIAQATKPEDRAMWVRDLADRIAASVQNEGYSDGAKRLEALYERFSKNDRDKDLAAHVKWLQVAAEYGLAINAPGADFAKIQADWVKKLEEYIEQFGSSPEAAEAMLQLGITEEFAGREEECKKWYARIVNDFPKSPAAAKAAGAKARLESVGEVLNFQGRTTKGGVVDLAKLRGQVVLLHYWATWCDPCKTDIATIKDLYNRFGRSGFAVVGVNLDSTQQEMDAFLAENPLAWPQIYEEGGLDSRPANELGVLNLPLMLLIDRQGRVVNRAILATEVEKELKRLLK